MKRVGILTLSQILSALIQIYITIVALNYYGQEIFSDIVRLLYIGFFYTALADLNFSLTLPKYLSTNTPRRILSKYYIAQVSLFLILALMSFILVKIMTDVTLGGVVFFLLIGCMQVIGSPAIYTVLKSTTLFSVLLISSRLAQLMYLQYSDGSHAGLMILFLIGLAPIAIGALLLLFRSFINSNEDEDIHGDFDLSHEVRIYFSKIMNGIFPNMLPVVVMPGLSDSYVAQFSILDRARRAGQLVLKNIALLKLRRNLSGNSKDVTREVERIFPRVLSVFALIYLVLCSAYWACSDLLFEYLNIVNSIPVYEVFFLVSVPIAISLSNYLMTNVLVHSLSSRNVLRMGGCNMFQGLMIFLFVAIFSTQSIIYPIAVYEIVSLFLAFLFMQKFSFK